MTGCAAKRSDVEYNLIRGDAPAYEDNLIAIGLIQTGKESDWREANTDNYLETFT